MLFEIDKCRNYDVLVAVKRDSWPVKEDLIKFQATGITRENFNFSHESNAQGRRTRESPLLSPRAGSR